MSKLKDTLYEDLSKYTITLANYFEIGGKKSFRGKLLRKLYNTLYAKCVLQRTVPPDN
jgi:hypothetical protein